MKHLSASLRTYFVILDPARVDASTFLQNLLFPTSVGRRAGFCLLAIALFMGLTVGIGLPARAGVSSVISGGFNLAFIHCS